MTKNTESLKIFVSCHKPSDFVEDNAFYPVQVGAALTDKRIIGAQPDNEGENISDLNPKFCELTAQYWAWKNADAEYYGFFHYRRYLAFRNKLELKNNVWGCLDAKSISEKNIDAFGLSGDIIRDLVEQYDIILPERKSILTMPNMGKTLREQYSVGALHHEDLQIMLDVIQEKYPDYLSYANTYLDGHMTYFNNMFIMKKELFYDYCEWLFDILFECEKRIDYTNYSVEAIRTPGHLAERLLNIYLLKLQDDQQLKVKELPIVVFNDTDPIINPEPAFKKNNVTIALSADDFYAPYIATAITSIIKNSSSTNNYDIFVMHKNIANHNQARMKRLVAPHNNFSLRFINIGKFEDRFSSLFLRGHFTIETWFRLLMPELFKEYKKVLYIDADLVVNADLAELYNTDVTGYLLAACHDADTAGLYNGFEPKKKDYTDNILKLKKPYSYFQAGVILFNLDEFRRTYTVEEMLKLAASREWQLLDQDVLNILAEDKVKFVDMAWNVMFDWRYMRRAEIISLAPKYLSDEWDEAHVSPKIIHYAGPDKPWIDPLSDYADMFWKYAKDSLFYEEIVKRMVTFARQPQSKSFKRFVRANIIDKTFPVNTKRREKAIKAYLKMRRRS